MPTPREFRFRLIRAEDTSNPYAFDGKPKRYLLVDEHGTGEALFRWDEVDEDLQEFLRQPEPPQDIRRRLGRKLQDFLVELLKTQRGWPFYEKALREAEEKRQHLSVVFQLGAVELFSLPWPLTELKNGQSLGGLRQSVVQLEWTRDAPVMGTSPQPGRMLFAWSDAGDPVPQDAHRAALQETCPHFQPSRDELEAVTLDGLKDRLETAARGGDPIRILHLLCHGGEMQDGSFGLVWASANRGRGTSLVEGTSLKRVLGPYVRELQLVVLNACHGGNPGRVGSMYGGVAHDLHRLGIPAVVASQRPLSCKGSVQMTRAFYRTLFSQGASIPEAFQAARSSLSEETLDWASLQLFAPGQASAGARARPPLMGRRVVFSEKGELPDLVSDSLGIAYEVNLAIPSVSMGEAVGAQEDGEVDTVVLRPLGRVEEALPATKQEWKKAFMEAERFVKALEQREDSAGNQPVVHLFGCAPLPLMFHLGWRLSRRPLRVYQQHRGGRDSWSLGYDSSQPLNRGERFLHVQSWPEGDACRAAGGRVGVTVEVTRAVDEARLGGWLGDGGSPLPVVRLVAAGGPSSTAVKGPQDTARAVADLRECLDDIHNKLPEVREVWLALLCPASLAAALGRAFNPKAQPPHLRLFNYRAAEGYVPVHTLGPPTRGAVRGRK